MANILIDGYNFMGIAHRNLGKARSDLIQRLGRYAKGKGHEITVIFDGWKDGGAEKTREHIGGVTVIYSSRGEKADQVIKTMLTSTSKPWIVVSSDREVYNFAEKKFFAALTGDEFEAKLETPLDFPEGEEEPLDDGYLGQQKGAGKKGNPRKLSKKDRRRLAALKKL